MWGTFKIFSSIQELMSSWLIARVASDLPCKTGSKWDFLDSREAGRGSKSKWEFQSGMTPELMDPPKSHILCKCNGCSLFHKEHKKKPALELCFMKLTDCFWKTSIPLITSKPRLATILGPPQNLTTHQMMQRRNESWLVEDAGDLQDW